MASYGFDSVIAKPRMPVVGGTVNGAFFTIPRNTLAITIHLPALVASATVKLQTLDPQGSELSSTEAWRDVKVFNLAAGGVTALSAIAGDAAVTLPAAATGSGVFRLVASSDQSSVPINITITASRAR